MKRFQIILLALTISGMCGVSVQAGNSAVNGMIIGAGSGAIIGQAAGRNAESTLIGTAVGGAVGYVIGSELESNRGRRVIVHENRYQPVVHHYTPVSYYRDSPYRSYPHYNNRNKTCRETVKVKNNHGKHTRVVTTSCNNGKPYGNSWRHDNWHQNNSNNRWHR